VFSHPTRHRRPFLSALSTRDATTASHSPPGQGPPTAERAGQHRVGVLRGGGIHPSLNHTYTPLLSTKIRIFPETGEHDRFSLISSPRVRLEPEKRPVSLLQLVRLAQDPASVVNLQESGAAMAFSGVENRVFP
jgi:hypothetical protein